MSGALQLRYQAYLLFETQEYEGHPLELTSDHLSMVLSVFFRQGTEDKKKCNSTHKGGQVVRWHVGQ